MTSFLNNAFRRFLAAAMAGIWVAIGGPAATLPGIGAEAWAQSSQPLRLAPAIKKDKPEETGLPAPRQSVGDIANPRPRSLSSRITGGAVEVDSLKALNAEEAGTLTPQTGALGQNMWAGTSRQLIERLLVQLPTRAPSAAMRELIKKLLLSPARVPERRDGGVGLIETRLSVLMNMGALDDANDLFDALPVARTSELVELEAELRLLSNDNARACALAAREMVSSASSYWQKVNTFCQIIKGENEKAQLSLLLMRELGEPDQAFLAMGEGLIQGVTPDLSTLRDPTPLHLAMARVGKVELPGDVMTANTPSVLRAIAMSPKASMGLRLEAAERADVAGALPVDSLRQLYTSVAFSKEDLANPLSRAEVEFGPMVRALLYHTSLLQTVPTAQAEAVERAFALARDEGRYASTVHVFEPVLRRIPPSSQLLWFAPEAVRALLLAGDRPRAEAWFQVLRAGALANSDAALAINQFRPLAKLFAFDLIDDADLSVAQAWWQACKEKPDAYAKGELLFTILQALGVSVAQEDWEPLIRAVPRSQQTVANAALLNRLRSLTEQALQRPPETEETTPVAAGPDLELKVPGPADLTRGPQLVSAEPAPRLSDGPEALLATETLAAPDQSESGAQRIGETVMLALLALGDSGPANAEIGVLGLVLRALTAAGLEEDARALALEAALANGL